MAQLVCSSAIADEERRRLIFTSSSRNRSHTDSLVNYELNQLNQLRPSVIRTSTETTCYGDRRRSSSVDSYSGPIGNNSNSNYHGHHHSGYGTPPGQHDLRSCAAANKRLRTAFTSRQLEKLERTFDESPYVVGVRRRQLARELGLTETQVRERIRVSMDHLR